MDLEDICNGDNYVDFMDEIIEQLLNEVRQVYREKNTLTDELLSALNFIFRAPLLWALDLVDRRSVALLTSPSGRKLFRVKGSKGVPYYCYTNAVYCQCPAYQFSVLQKEEYVMCKHVLAAKLSEAMDVCSVEPVSEEQLTALFHTLDCPLD